MEVRDAITDVYHTNGRAVTALRSGDLAGVSEYLMEAVHRRTAFKYDDEEIGTELRRMML